MVYAKTKNAAAALSKQVAEGKMQQEIPCCTLWKTCG